MRMQTSMIRALWVVLWLLGMAILAFACGSPTAPSKSTELIYNGNFTLGLDGWKVWVSPSVLVGDHMVAFQRLDSQQGTIFQDTGHAVPGGTRLSLTFEASGGVRLVAMIVDSDFSRTKLCEFRPHARFLPYRCETETVSRWQNVAVYFYAGTIGDVYMVRQVSLRREP